MAAKKIDEAYIKYGFTHIAKDGIQLPQCVVCLKTLSNDATRPSRLGRHLSQNHGNLIKKTGGVFSCNA
jgi:hypothetical protein